MFITRIYFYSLLLITQECYRKSKEEYLVNSHLLTE